MKQESCSLGLVTPDDWARRLSGPADLSSERANWPNAMLRHWTGTAAVMEQPPLDHHYIVQHLGGSKRVDRRCDGQGISTIVDDHALTIVPVGTAYQWRTTGPIEFAHLYISPATLNAAAIPLGRGDALSLIDKVGCRDPLLESIFTTLLAELGAADTPEILFLDSLLDTFLMRLVLYHGSVRLKVPSGREVLSGLSQRRLLEFIENRLAGPLVLADMAAYAGSSVFHFARAFKNSFGETPYAYVVRRRLDRARGMLTHSVEPVEQIARVCGFTTPKNFVRTFTRRFGMTPTRYRQQ